MTGHDDLGMQLRRHYLATADDHVADGQLDVVLDRTRATRQRAGWLVRLREPLRGGGGAGAQASRLAWIAVLIVLAALVAALLALALGSSQPRKTIPIVFTGEGIVYVIDVDTGLPRPMFDAPAQRIHLSPDGQYALFEALRADRPEIVLARTDGTTSRTLTDPGEYELGPQWESVWAPDLHAVAWLSWRDGVPVLMVADAEGGDPRPIAAPVSEDPHLVWSPDNVHVAYVDWGCESTTRHLSIIDTESGTTLELGQDLMLPSLPVWARDGHRLAAAVMTGDVVEAIKPDPDTLICVERAGPREIIVGDVATSAATTIASDVDAFNLAWSAEDRAVMGIVAADTGGHDIVTIPAAGGGELEPLAHLDQGGGAIWSPDRTQVAWTSVDSGPTETFSLWVMDVAEGETRRLARDVPGGGPEGWPKWSPDGAWIAFFRASTDPDAINGGSIYIVHPDGSGERLLVDEGLGVDLAGVDW